MSLLPCKYSQNLCWLSAHKLACPTPSHSKAQLGLHAVGFLALLACAWVTHRQSLPSFLELSVERGCVQREQCRGVSRHKASLARISVFALQMFHSDTPTLKINGQTSPADPATLSVQCQPLGSSDNSSHLQFPLLQDKGSRWPFLVETGA